MGHLPKRLFKVYSEFGHQISVRVSPFMDQKTDPQWLAWIMESPYWTSKSTMHLELPYVPTYLRQTESVEPMVQIVYYAFAGAEIFFSGGAELVYSEFGHQISVHVSAFMDQKTDPQWLDWIIESPYWTSESSDSNYSVQNTTSHFMWRGEIVDYGVETLMVILPRSTFSVKDGDDRIILEADGFAKVYGIHLLNKIEEYDSTTDSEN
ncbi:hypothetical protein POM88_023584 [Heracleum sosnowskyi]|uniref:Uncharacterized protein n=1 Tax=Heracleum sosnowskyi TaxID=360622 RepID=A0AAD8MUR4_9APIA|nr:hypothetical protein POM88_023584 [Heracleum sosnowskyi]